MDDLDDGDEALQIGERTWNRAVKAAEKEGFREGVEEGADQVLQKDFDEGYEDGFRIAFILGHYKGLAAFLFKNIDHPKEINDILEITRRGACYICEVESKQENKDDDETILHNHREHTLKICKKLKAYFDPLLKNKGIDTDFTKELNLE
ncbi:protein YAE1 homolog [Chelonus insularis]|uniref:protein YAE1 homolog n=1 Tax=Chelonus insularis TaxID=460826 RepID=UPI00158B3C21|nr:protein YAE1 homolog [Chelonus insularis]